MVTNSIILVYSSTVNNGKTGQEPWSSGYGSSCPGFESHYHIVDFSRIFVLKLVLFIERPKIN